jgi:hypothetical protein
VLVEPGTGRVRITDFGLARAADDASLTRSGTVAGTPLYMAPEQAKGEALDHRADLFSLGSVLYAVLTGRPPFRADTTLAVLKRVADDTPRPIREVIPEVPEWFCRVVEKLHAKNPSDRFQTAREVADVLADCEAQLAAHKELVDFSRIPGGRPRRRRRWLSGTAVVVLGVLLGVGARLTPPVLLYAAGNGRIAMTQVPGLYAIAVQHGEYGPWDRFALHDASGVDLPPGKYRIEAEINRGREVEGWEITTGRLTSVTVTWHGVEKPLIELKRGERVRVKPVLREYRPKPDPTPPPKSQPVLLKRFDPATDKPTLPWGDPKNVRPDDGGWRIENNTNRGNFRARLGILLDDLPTEGLIVFKAKVRVKANEKIGWGDLQLGDGGPKFHGYDWPEDLGRYDGDVTVWTEKEMRYPASVFHKKNPPSIPVYVGMHSNGVVWVKDAEVWHIPVDPRKAEVLKPLRDAVAATTGTLELTKKRYEAGTVSKIEVLRAEGDLVAARVAYSEAEGDAKAAAERLAELVRARQEERDLVALRVQTGVERAEVLNQADARLAEAKAKAAKTKP